jgi:hypothetical protein
VLDEIDEHGFGPLQVVDDHDLWTLGGARLEEPAEGELRLGWRRSHDRGRLDADRGEGLDERPVRDPLAVGETSSPQDVGRVADALEEVGDEAGLADPGRAEQREESTGAIGDGVLVVAPEPLALALAADERRLEMTRDGAASSITSVSPERLDGLRLALERERLDHLELDRIAHEQARLATDEDLPGARRLLESGGDVDRVAGDESLAPRHRPRPRRC